MFGPPFRHPRMVYPTADHLTRRDHRAWMSSYLARAVIDVHPSNEPSSFLPLMNVIPVAGVTILRPLRTLAPVDHYEDQA